MGRTANLLLVAPSGELLGMLPPLALACPFWPESADVVGEVEARFHARVVMLRLLESDPSRRAGGEVSYLAELVSGAPNVALSPASDELRESAQRREPKRMPWAELGGVAQSLAWAREALKPSGQCSFNAVQQRTWNLSTLWRLESEAAPANPIWLKQVPHFMYHEGRVLRWLNEAVPGAAPLLVAADDRGRSLLAHVPGADLYGASVATRHQILARLHEVQRSAAGALDELLALGVPDLRGRNRALDVAQKLSTWSLHYPGLSELLRRFERQLELLEESGLPATLVHSDNHPGNARGGAGGVTLLDWGEAFIGHPITDLVGLIDGLAPADADSLIEHWCSAWKDVAPRSRPELALDSARFLAAMHGAATYAYFLQQIEETESPYHREDVPRCLELAIELLSPDKSLPRSQI